MFRSLLTNLIFMIYCLKNVFCFAGSFTGIFVYKILVYKMLNIKQEKIEANEVYFGMGGEGMPLEHIS